MKVLTNTLDKPAEERFTVGSGVAIVSHQRSGRIKDSGPLIDKCSGKITGIYLLNAKETVDVVRLLMVSLIVSNQGVISNQGVRGLEIKCF